MTYTVRIEGYCHDCQRTWGIGLRSGKALLAQLTNHAKRFGHQTEINIDPKAATPEQSPAPAPKR